MTQEETITCECCGKPCDAKLDVCYGCGHVVCIDCVEKYTHWVNGEHGGIKAELPKGWKEE